MPVIELDEVSFSYGGGTRVLDAVSLSIAAGEFIAVLGHNGSGKSTLARLLNALLIPSAGTVRVNGMDTREPEYTLQIRQTVGMVFQNPDNQTVATIVEEDVAFALENLGVPQPEIRRRVDEALAAVSMTGYAGHAPHRLSGGQKQRIAIAGILAMRPAVLVLDEPTAMLDPSGRGEVLKTLEELRRDYGVSIVLITHHMGEAAGADRAVVLRDGKVFFDGTPRRLYSEPDTMRQARLAPPQTVELLQELNRTACRDMPVGVLSTHECADTILGELCR